MQKLFRNLILRWGGLSKVTLREWLLGAATTKDSTLLC